jgi:ABC-type transporter Mla subunit MlaD
MRFERDDAKIGLLVIIAGAVFVAFVFHRSVTAAVKKESIIKVRLDNVSGLEVGTEVQLQGYRVGQVNHIALQREGPEYYFLATLGVQPDIVLWKGTIALVSSKGIGSSYLDLDLPPAENRRSPLEADAILYGETGASLGTMVTEVQGFVQNLNGTLDDLKAHFKEKGLDDVLDHPQVRKVLVDLDATLIEFRKAATRGDLLLKQGQDSAEILDRSLTSLEKSALMVEALLKKRSGDIDDIIGNLATLLHELQSLSLDMHTLLKNSGPEVEQSLKSLHRNLIATEELLEVLKNKPSRVVWGTPSEAEKEAARKRVKQLQQQAERPPDAPPAGPPPIPGP